jgi:hypothetical protein
MLLLSITTDRTHYKYCRQCSAGGCSSSNTAALADFDSIGISVLSNLLSVNNSRTPVAALSANRSTFLPSTLPVTQFAMIDSASAFVSSAVSVSA